MPGLNPPPHPDHPSDEQVSAAATLLGMLADPTRVRILWALKDGECDVTTLAEAGKCAPAAASQHLAKLRLAGLVEGTKQGRRVIYKMRGGHVRALLMEALFHADHQVTGEPIHD